MALQVRVRVRCSSDEEKLVSVSSSRQEFDKFTIRQLREKLSQLRLFPEIDPHRLCVFYEDTFLEDDRTFGSCRIQPRSLLEVDADQFVAQGGPIEADRGVPRTRSMEVLASMEQTDPESENQCCIM